MYTREMKFSRLRLLEFFLIGLVMGILEDIIAISLATNETIDLQVIIIAGLVALPFAVISEIVVDLKRFPAWLHNILNKIEGLERRVEDRTD